MIGLGLLFSSVEDPRAGNARFDLSDLLLIAFAAVLCGAESCVEIAEFGQAKRELLASIVSLDHGTPSHDTFSRLFRLLNPRHFEAAFRTFMSRFAATVSGQIGHAGQIIALDGKSLRAAVDAAKPSQPLHLVTAWAAEQRLVLGLCRAPGRSEVTAAREIIAMLDLTAATVTADALHGNRATAAAIVDRGGDYVLALKANRGPLYRDAQVLLAKPAAKFSAITTEKSHGRQEKRQAWVKAVPQEWQKIHKFKGLAAIARIDSTRLIKDKQSRETRYFVLSRMLEAREALRIVRAHWTIENNQHWLLDVAFREDSISSRNDNTAENLAIMRRLALNLIKSDPTKGSVKVKIKQAGWNDPFLLSLLAQMR